MKKICCGWGGGREREIHFLVLIVRSVARLPEQVSFPCGRSRDALSETTSHVTFSSDRFGALGELGSFNPPLAPSDTWLGPSEDSFGIPRHCCGKEATWDPGDLFLSLEISSWFGDLLGLAVWWLSRATDPVHTQLPWEATSAWCRHQGLGSWSALDNYCSLGARRNLDWI